MLTLRRPEGLPATATSRAATRARTSSPRARASSGPAVGTRSANSAPPILAARFGGEEFVLLLPQTSAEGAAHLAEELRHKVEALALPNPGSPFGVLTASFGVATFVPRDGGQPAELLAAADEALYDAKGAGRNRVAEG